MGCQHLHVHVCRILQCTHFMHYMWTVSTYQHSVWVFTHRLSLVSHTQCSCCIQDTPETTVPPFPNTGDTELTTQQEDITDRETTTVSSVYTGLLILMYVHDQAIFLCAYSCGSLMTTSQNGCTVIKFFHAKPHYVMSASICNHVGPGCSYNFNLSLVLTSLPARAISARA